PASPPVDVYTLSLTTLFRSRLDEGASTALGVPPRTRVRRRTGRALEERVRRDADWRERRCDARGNCGRIGRGPGHRADRPHVPGDRKSTRLNSSHVSISYAV